MEWTPEAWDTVQSSLRRWYLQHHGEQFQNFIVTCPICNTTCSWSGGQDRRHWAPPSQSSSISSKNTNNKGVDSYGVEYNYLMAVKDNFTRFFVLWPLRRKGASEVALVINWVFSWMGLPLTLQTDNGFEFKNSTLSNAIDYLSLRCIMVISKT